MILMATFHGFAAHMDPIFFLLLVGLSLLFRLLGGKKQKPDNSDETAPTTTRPESPRREVESSDEERIRRFLEALGQPQSTEPPPPVIPRPVATFSEPNREERARTVRPRRNLLNPLPPLTTTPPPLPRRVQPAQMTQQPSKPKSFVPPARGAPAFEAHQEEGAPGTDEPAPDAYAVAAAPGPVSAQPSQFVLDLRAPGALQGAIILREILGPPRSLAPLEIG